MIFKLRYLRKLKFALGPQTLIAVVLTLSMAPAAQAVHFGEETQAGSSTQIQSVSADGLFSERSKELDPIAHKWSWSGGYTRSRVSSTEATATSTTVVIDDTEEWTGGLGYLGDQGFGLDFGVAWSTTPAEELSVNGGDMTFSYNLVSKPSATQSQKAAAAEDDEDDDADDADDAFSPSVKFKFKVGKKTYEEQFSGSAQKITGGKKKVTTIIPTSGAIYLEDSYYGPALTWRPASAWSVDLSYQIDLFNSDVAQFQNYLNSSRAIMAGFGSFSNTTSGITQATDAFSVSYDAAEWLTIDALESYSISAVDLSPSYNSSLKFDLTLWEVFNLVLGVAYQSSSTSYDTIGTLGLGVRF